MPARAIRPPLQKFHGVVIRAFASREADLVMRVITPDFGKVALIGKQARRSRKRFASSFDLFDNGIFTVRRSRSSDSPAIVQEFTPAKSFRSLREDLGKLIIASSICECFDLLTPEELAHEECYFQTLLLGLEGIDDARDLREQFRVSFLALARLLSFSGYLEIDSLPPPSAKGLKFLLEQIEYFSERGLKSKASMLELMGDLRQSA